MLDRLQCVIMVRMVDHYIFMDPETQVEVLVPVSISRERAAARMKGEQQGRIRSIRVFPELGNEYSLWESGTSEYAKTPSDYGVSRALSEDIQRWTLTWEQECALNSGWNSPEAQTQWVRQGHDIVERLELELYDVARIIPEFASNYRG